jgi:hypothetical protein
MSNSNLLSTDVNAPGIDVPSVLHRLDQQSLPATDVNEVGRPIWREVRLDISAKDEFADARASLPGVGRCVSRVKVIQ